MLGGLAVVLCGEEDAPPCEDGDVLGDDWEASCLNAARATSYSVRIFGFPKNAYASLI